jgi:hypothetical protein
VKGLGCIVDTNALGRFSPCPGHGIEASMAPEPASIGDHGEPADKRLAGDETACAKEGLGPVYEYVPDDCRPDLKAGIILATPPFNSSDG